MLSHEELTKYQEALNYSGLTLAEVHQLVVLFVPYQPAKPRVTIRAHDFWRSFNNSSYRLCSLSSKIPFKSLALVVKSIEVFLISSYTATS